MLFIDITNIKEKVCILTDSSESLRYEELLSSTHFFFYKQPHFPVEPRVAIGSAQNEAQNCYEVANVFWRL